jgi:branched-chain amino acid transport system substrate-binding protein
MYKRIFALLSLLILASLVLAACAPAATPTEAPTTPPTEAPVMTEAPTTAPTEAPAMTEEPTVAPTEASMGGMPEACADNADQKACAVIPPGGSIKIGYAGPMTGDYSSFGIDISQAGLIAIQDNPDFEGFPFELDIQDTQGSGEGGAAVANLFVADPSIVAVAGHTFSGSTAAAIPIYNAARIPMLSPSATNADLTKGDQDVFNRIPFTDDIQGTKVAEYLYNNLNVLNLAVMSDGDTYGKGLGDKVAEVFQSLGGTLVTDPPVAITPGEADYTGALANLAALSPDALFYGGYDAEAAVIANQMSQSGLSGVILFSDDGTFGSNFIELTGPNGEGTFATSALPPASPAVDAFDAAYKAAYGIEAGSLSTFTWHGYDTVSALISVVKSVAVVGDDGNLYIPREAMVKGVRDLAGYPGLTGSITCNAEGECNTAGPTFFVVKDGAWVLAP